MIKINNICKNFKDFQALKNVTFDVNDGEIVGLLGENGAGKSTLLRIISTVLSASSGTAEVNGYDIAKEPEKVRKSIGSLFGSEVGLYEKLTARENIEYFAKLNGVSAEEANKNISKFIKIFSFEDYADKRVSKLSKGMKQKVSIVRSIVHNPKVMLFDEPESGLDFRAAKTVFDFMELCKSDGKSIIFSSHSSEAIKKYSDRIIVIHKGGLVKEINAKEYREKYSDEEFNDILFKLVCDGDENV